MDELVYELLKDEIKSENNRRAVTNILALSGISSGIIVSKE